MARKSIKQKQKLLKKFHEVRTQKLMPKAAAEAIGISVGTYYDWLKKEAPKTAKWGDRPVYAPAEPLVDVSFYKGDVTVTVKVPRKDLHTMISGFLG